jgi:hypothetical protein
MHEHVYLNAWNALKVISKLLEMDTGFLGFRASKTRTTSSST